MAIRKNSVLHSPARTSRLLLPGLVVGLALTYSVATPAQIIGNPGTTITVNTTADGFILTRPGQRLPCTLRDAILAANTDQVVGGCPAGARTKVVSSNPLQVDNIDQIEFDLGAGTPSIRLRWALPTINDAVSIDGSTGGADRVALDGGGIISFSNVLVNGLTVTGSFASIENLVIHQFSGNGILLTVEDEGGRPLPPRKPPEIDEEPPELVDPSLDPCGPYSYPSNPDDCPFPGGGGGPDLPPIGNGAGGGHYVAGCLIGTDASGEIPLGNGRGGEDQAGIVVLTNGNQIGGRFAAERNVIAGNNGHGILLSGVNNVVENNTIGSDATGRIDLRNLHDGIRVDGGQFANASCHIRNNVIAYNNGDGVSGGYNLCAVLSNGIHTHGELGIDMAIEDVTANDPAGTRRRPPNAPMITNVQTKLKDGGALQFVTEITGTVNHRRNEPVHVQVFHSNTCSASGYGEGEWSVSKTKTVQGGGIRPFRIYVSPLLRGGVFTATATVDNSSGSGVTSEFSACYYN